MISVTGVSPTVKELAEEDATEEGQLKNRLKPTVEQKWKQLRRASWRAGIKKLCGARSHKCIYADTIMLLRVILRLQYFRSI